MRSRRHVAGWDVGGVNTKVARAEDGEIAAVCGRPFELQRAPDRLVPLLRDLAAEAGCPADSGAVAHGVTMTAELSQMFRTKRDGVAFVLNAMQAAFPASDIGVFTVDGRFLSPADARADPLAVAAANWSATAHLVALAHPDAVLVDIGTTTTDIIPIAAGRVVARGRTDPERLASGELVYTGALRTPAEAIASEIPLHGEALGVSAEGFAIAGDVHLWRGDLAPADYTVPAPDGRPATKEFAGERLARVVCADREMLEDDAVEAIAEALAGAQAARIASAIRRVVGHHPSLRTAVVTGLGGFLGAAAARSAGLDVVMLAGELGDAAARFAPAAAVALLFDPGGARNSASELRVPSTEYRVPSTQSRVPSTRSVAEIVVKVGGALLDQAERLSAVLSAVEAAGRTYRLLIVPGGGPFADAVRHVDSRLRLSDDAAHWMAVLGMDQYAHLLAERLGCGKLVTTLRDVKTALDDGRVPVLAPSRWLREVDPLPHSWDVTSDSIAAWVAGAVGARRLVLVKSAGAAGSSLVDPHFSRALPLNVVSQVVAADELGAALAGRDQR
jgi:probable H4MPT-linked C1 transfer pathway protein